MSCGPRDAPPVSRELPASLSLRHSSAHRTNDCRDDLDGPSTVRIVAVFARLCGDTIRESTQRGLGYARIPGRIGDRARVTTPKRIATPEGYAPSIRAGRVSVARSGSTHRVCGGRWLLSERPETASVHLRPSQGRRAIER